MYAWKTNEFGQVVRAKARLVARGFSQREGVDYLETFSPCPCVPSIRLLTAIACELGLDLCHFDAEQAFVQSTLDEEVYLRLPQGCGALSGKVVKLALRFETGVSHVAQPFGASDAVPWFRAVCSGCVCDARGGKWYGVHGGCGACGRHIFCRQEKQVCPVW